MRQGDTSVDQVRILRDGAQAFPAMLGLIAQAREEVLFENFIFAGDHTGQLFAGALSTAARRGVRVQVLYDPVGTLMVKGGSIARVLKSDGVDARAFRPLSVRSPWTLWRLRHRDHRKSLIVDGRVCVVGGLCISDNWLSASQGGHGWRDTALQVEGPVAQQVRKEFDAMWRDRHDDRTIDFPAALNDSSHAAAYVLADQPGASRTEHVYSWLARHAAHQLDIADAYLLMPSAVKASLIEASRRGVRVRVLTPQHNNHLVTAAAARAGYQGLLDAGIELYEWRGTMMHAKTAVMDKRVSLVGSSNLDPLSMRRNYELNLLVTDPAIGTQMQRMFEDDTHESTPIRPSTWRQRPSWLRVAEGAASLLAPEL